MRSPLQLALVLIGVLALSACEEEVGPDSNGFPPEPDRSSAENLLTDWFEKAYSRKDSVLYEAMLDDLYQFEFLPEDADSLRHILGQFNYWGKTNELRIAGALFRSPHITTISLDIRIISNDEYGGGGCDGCREIESAVTLRILTAQTTGGAPLILTVDSPQLLVVKPDPANTMQWVLWRQYDQPRGLKSGLLIARAPAADTGISWGTIKAFYFPF